MAKKVFIGIAILLAGFMIGAFSFRLHEKKFPSPLPGAIVPQASVAFLHEEKGDFSQTVKAVSPAVVNIATVKVLNSGRDEPYLDFYDSLSGPFYEPKKWKEQTLGSGVLVSPDGYIITNYHVVSNSEKIKVTLYDKRVLDGKVIGADPKTDLAVVKISAQDLPTLAWGDSDNLKVGEFVLAIGNAYGLSHTVTMGIISAVGRADVGIADYEDFIQTDAAINPGNSGGPLVDGGGNLIGINTAIFSRSGGYQGIGFAVPSNMARFIMEQLLKEGKVVRGWLGINIQELTPELSREFGYDKPNGVLVVESVKGGPAEKSGVRNGDIITGFGGKDVESTATLKNMAAESKPGSRVPLKILRQGRRLSAIVTVEELPIEIERAAPSEASTVEKGALSGLSTMTLTADVARQLGIEGKGSGVVIVGVEDGSPADEAGLRRGDVILECDHSPVSSLDEFRRITLGMRPDNTVLMFVNRGGRKFYITLGS